MTESSALAVRHLALRLRPLSRALAVAVRRQTELAAQLVRPDVTPLCVTDEQVAVLLSEIEGGFTREVRTDAWALTAAELEEESELRARAQALGLELPLDRLARELGLCELELRALLICAAPELERSYERVYAYVLDDLNRRWPCVELAVELCAGDWAARMQVRTLTGPYGALQRLGVLKSLGDSATELRQQLRCGEGLLEFLGGANPGYPEGRRDPEAVVWAARQVLPNPSLQREVQRLGECLRAGALDCVGIWGPESRGLHAALQELAAAMGAPLRQFRPHPRQTGALREALAAALNRTAALGACLWIELEGLEAPLLSELRQALENEAPQRATPLVLSAATAWRSLALLQARRYAELTLAELDFPDRVQLLQGLDPNGAAHDLAQRYRLGPGEAAALARLAGAGDPAAETPLPAPDALERAAALVTRRSSTAYATVLEPTRPASDLVLPEAAHRDVLQIADFYRAWPRVRHEWGLVHLTQAGGLKALFSGESGTGKTLAAEVIASRLNMPLMKVELSQVVSKWVGVTEQQLDNVFRDAHEMRAVLFFDEADALFGKRGEVRHGMDRYANLEVSYLLQKLEDPAFSGLYLFATNLSENLDPGFSRRFQFVVHFPRPNEEDRRRIWQLALPEHVRLSASVDLDRLSRLDMTGAAIISAARTAALLAASEGAAEISAAQLLDGIRRRFKHEGRMLLESDVSA